MPRRTNVEVHKPFIFYQSCQDKHKYKNEKEALAAAEMQMLRNMSLELSVYKCNDCRYWHLTRQIKRDNNI
jgi:hypothetical protein